MDLSTLPPASYSHHRLSGTKKASFSSFTAKTSQTHHANEFGGIIETGYEFALPYSFIATPMLNLGLVRLAESGYMETGAGTLGLTVKSQGRTYVQSKAGAQLAKYLTEGETQLYGFIKIARG